MMNFIGTLRMDIKRSFFSVSFLIAVLGVCGSLLLSASTDITSTENDIVYFRMLAHTNSIKLLLITFSAISYSSSFCFDWNNAYIKPVLVRTSISSYSFSKIISCALSAGFSAALGEFAFILIMRLRYPLVNINAGTHENMILLKPFGYLLSNDHIIVYFLSFIIIQFVFSALFSVIAFWVSTYITNLFVTLSSPILIYLFIINFINIFELPAYFNPAYIFSGKLFLRNAVFSLLYPIIISLVLIIIIGYFSYKQIKKRVKNI